METFKKVCENFWCKVPFTYTSDMIQVIDGEEIRPKQCPKCHSFATELSGGVTWSEKTYEGDRWDGMSHQISYRVTNFR